MYLEFYRQIFEKYLKIKLHENPFKSEPVFLMERRMDRLTDRHDEANSCAWQFCERA
jgi:hypothetical protein